MTNSVVIPLVWAACFVALLVAAIRRVYFSPLSHIPGPKSAALTFFGELYWSYFQSGKYVWKLQEWHKKYGPIIRINPEEVHIMDSEFFDELYVSQKKADKYEWWVKQAGIPGSTFATVRHDHHRVRQSAIAPFFSAQSVRKLEPVIRQKVEKFSQRLRAMAGTGEVIRYDVAFMALTVDIISDYAFGDDVKRLDKPDFDPLWLEIIRGGLQSMALMMFFPWLLPLMRALPLRVTAAINPIMAHMIRWEASSEEAVKTILERKDPVSLRGEKGEKTTIFHTLRDDPDLPAQEKTLQRLTDEGQSILLGGSETTAQTLTRLSFYLKHEPQILERLRAELDTAMPDPSAILPWPDLQQLPYFSATVKEALRFQCGVTRRLPRILQHELQYKEYTIPAGTPISQTPYFVLVDPLIFPHPDKFRPERWLDPDHKLDHYLVGFSKGTRQCIGINLAYAELYLTISMLVRRFDWDMYETGLADVVPKHDFLLAMSDVTSKGVRATIRLR